jgi:hypothetical protein
MKSAGQSHTHRPFNCDDQGTLAWRQRADACVALLRSIVSPCDGLLSLADIGCGDQKLRDALRVHGVQCRYQGYDLLPQSLEVHCFDVRRDSLPKIHDIAVMLGVIEYLRNLPEVLMALAPRVPYLIVSHVFRQNGLYTAERLAELGWLHHLSEKELDGILTNSGFSVIERCIAPDTRTLLLSCRSTRCSLLTRCE